MWRKGIKKYFLPTKMRLVDSTLRWRRGEDVQSVYLADDPGRLPGRASLQGRRQVIGALLVVILASFLLWKLIVI